MKHKLIVGGVSSTELRDRIMKLRMDSESMKTAASKYLNILGLTTKGVVEYILKADLYK